jgi:hypothetical protein
MNLGKLFPDHPSTPLSKHCKGLRMQQRLLPRSLHPGSCDTTVSREQVLTAPQVKKRKRQEEAQGNTRFSLSSPVVLRKARGKLSLVNIVGDVDGLSKGMLLIGSEKIA